MDAFRASSRHLLVRVGDSEFEVDFDGGRGYAEKDWGRSMPRSDSFMLSLARIPWLGSGFPGFLCAASLGGRLVLEATWTGARVAGLDLRDDRVRIAVAAKGILSRRIAESVDATMRLRWSKGGKVLFEGEAVRAGLELVGDPASLFRIRTQSGNETDDGTQGAISRL